MLHNLLTRHIRDSCKCDFSGGSWGQGYQKRRQLGYCKTLPLSTLTAIVHPNPKPNHSKLGDLLLLQHHDEILFVSCLRVQYGFPTCTTGSLCVLVHRFTTKVSIFYGETENLLLIELQAMPAKHFPHVQLVCYIVFLIGQCFTLCDEIICF